MQLQSVCAGPPLWFRSWATSVQPASCMQVSSVTSLTSLAEGAGL